MKKRILIIDDEEAYADVLKINLEDAGLYETDASLDAPAGFEKLEKQKYDLILLDILMPKIEGHEALAKIRKICDTPIIIMSGYLTPQQQELILKAGASACFLKSDSFDQIHQMIKQVISRH